MGVMSDCGMKESDIPDLLRSAADEFDWARGAGEPEASEYRRGAAAKVARVYRYTNPEPVLLTDPIHKD